VGSVRAAPSRGRPAPGRLCAAPHWPGCPKKRLKASPQRRALYELASHLRCTVAWLERNLSAQEFHEWHAWLDAHRIGPRWDALRHAELLAAATNGALRRRDARTWAPRDFMPLDPWDDAPADPGIHSVDDFMALLPGGPDA
jgi:hypothetical protein